MSKSFKLIIFVLLAVFPAACKPGMLKNPEITVNEQASESLLRVSVTSQSYFFHRPWQQRRPVSRNAMGVIVPGGRVLVTAFVVADQRYIELETLDSRKKQRAEVEVVDYESNLALLKPTDPAFLDGRKPMPLAADTVVGDELSIWQVKPNGDVVIGGGKVTSVELTAFSLGHFFLAYRMDSALQYRFNNLTLPVVKGKRLAGLVLRYSSSDRALDVISTPVIRHFLADAAQQTYRGFPVAGFQFGPAIDPQLRRYMNLPENLSGIYVQKVIKGGPADRAGLKEGDLITRMGGFELSNTGQYDHPLYGKTSVIHMIRTGYHVGEKLPIQLYRGGEAISVEFGLDHRRPDEYLVPPFIIDRPPNYLIVGGLVVQELSLSYLQEYGNEWEERAPIDLLYYNQNQDYLNGDSRRKITIVSGVIPTPYTIGYENLSNLVVQRINDKRIDTLADVRTALEKPLNGFHKIEVEQHPRVIYLDPREVPLIHRMIEERYRIKTDPAVTMHLN